MITFCAVGFTQPSFTFLAPLPTVLVNHPNPFVSAATGSRWNSSTPGIVVVVVAFSAEEETGALPKPAYLPPWLLFCEVLLTPLRGMPSSPGIAPLPRVPSSRSALLQPPGSSSAAAACP